MWHSKQDFPGGNWYWHVPVHNLPICLGFTNTFYYGMACTVLHQHGSPGANATCEWICREVLTGLAAILVELSQNPYKLFDLGTESEIWRSHCDISVNTQLLVFPNPSLPGSKASWDSSSSRSLGPEVKLWQLPLTGNPDVWAMFESFHQVKPRIYLFSWMVH